VLPPPLALLTHHLHCAMHSAPVAAAVTLLVWLVTRSLWIPLLGWWSHIVVDVFTHSAEFYPVPVFYPFTQWGFDGLAWNTPWFLVANHLAIAGALLSLWLTPPRLAAPP
jgi:LexA-binding, inner membrane-associated putative hydrolase